jgi:hypothetical protein
VSFCKLFGLSKLFPRSKRFAAYGLPYLSPDKQHRVEVLSGAFMLLRHKALDETGLLDESFFMYGEDIDLSYRMVLGGYKNYYLPERILHYKGESTKHGDKKYIKAFYGAMLIFYKKYYPQSSKLISGLIRCSVFLRGAYAALFEKKKKIKKVKNRHLLVLCREEHYERVRTLAMEQMPELELVNRWNLDEKRAIEAINRRVRMQTFTDIAFCYPDMSFDQMLLFMDRMVKKTTIYHIYHSTSGRLVSPGKNDI